MELTSKATKYSPVISLGVTVLLILLLTVFVSRQLEEVRAFIHQSGWYGLLISIGLYGLLGFSPIPSEPLTILLSTVYGPFTATLVAGTGNLLAAVMEYVVGTQIGDIANFEKRRETLPLGLGRFPVHSVPFLLIARSLPGYGPKFVSVLSGVYHVPMWRYCWTAAIPTFVGSAVFAYGGFGLLNLRPS